MHTAAQPSVSQLEATIIRRVTLRLVPFLMVCYFVSFVDRVNLGFAALQMVRELDDEGLKRLSKEGQLALSLAEMRTIQAHFREQGRDPSDVELETIAQTWSEHCSHKTLKGQIEFRGKRYQNLLKETIFAATQEIRRRPSIL